MIRGPQLGILGGTFDPIHNGHLQLASIARRALGLTQVLLIPAGRPPLKGTTTASAACRLRMVELACAGRPELACSDVEIRRPGRSYTVDTLRAIRKASPWVHLWFLIGRDALGTIDQWREHPSLFELASFAVVSRQGEPASPRIVEMLPAADRALFERDHDLVGADGIARAAWRHRSGEQLTSIEIAPDDVSSTAIRAALARGEDVSERVPAAVASYIARHGLYREKCADDPRRHGRDGDDRAADDRAADDPSAGSATSTAIAKSTRRAGGAV